MPTFPCAGCAYRYPEPDDPRVPNAPPTKNENLRRWHLRKIAARMRGLRIMLNHKLDGTIFDGYKNKMVRPEIQTGVSGERPIGTVLNGWIDPKTGALHWSGELRFSESEKDLTALFRAGYLAECSLHHTVEDPVVGGRTKTHKIRLVEISMCFKGARPGSVVVSGADVFTYMRNTGFNGQISNHPPVPIMASVSETSPVVAESAPIHIEAAADPRGQKRSLDESESEANIDVRRVLENSTPEQILLIKSVMDRAHQAEEKAAQLDAEVVRSKKEASEASLATQELFRQAWNQFNQAAPISTNAISIAASAAAAMGPEECGKFHANLVKATAELHATMNAAHQQQVQQARQTSVRSQEVDDILRGLSRQGYNTAAAVKSVALPPAPITASRAGVAHNMPQEVSVAASAAHLAAVQAPAPVVASSSVPIDISSIPRGNAGYAAIENFLVGRYEVHQQ